MWQQSECVFFMHQLRLVHFFCKALLCKWYKFLTEFVIYHGAIYYCVMRYAHLYHICIVFIASGAIYRKKCKRRKNQYERHTVLFGFFSVFLTEVIFWTHFVILKNEVLKNLPFDSYHRFGFFKADAFQNDRTQRLKQKQS